MGRSGASEPAFVGRGKVRLAHRGDTILLRFNAATTQTRQLRALISGFIRKEAAFVRPSFAPFEVRIWISVGAERRGAYDVDNVAKACLDALKGLVWRDDRQVARLQVERFAGEGSAIAVRARPLREPPGAVALDEGLLDV